MSDLMSPPSEYRVRTLDNGARVAVVSVPDAPNCVGVVWVRSGPCYESAEQGGLGHFVEHVVLRGNATFADSVSLHRAAGATGGQLDGDTCHDSVRYELRFLPEECDAAITILSSLVVAPRLAEDVIELERSVILHEAQHYLDANDEPVRPADVARELLFSGSALAHHPLGTRRAVTAFTAAELRAHVERHYTGPNIVAVIGGPLPLDALESMARGFGAVRAGALVPSNLAARPQLPRRILRTLRGATTVRYMFELMSTTVLERDVLWLIFDDGLRSPINRRVSEECGLAYTVMCDFRTRASVTLLDVWAHTDLEEATGVLGAMASAVHDLMAAPFLASELEVIKARLRYMDRQEGVQSAHRVDQLAAALLHGTELPDFELQRASARALTVGHIEQLLHRLDTLSSRAVVITGDGRPVDPE